MATKVNMPLRALPAVDAVLKLPSALALCGGYGRAAVADAVRAEVARLRAAILDGGTVDAAACSAEAVIERVAGTLGASSQPHLRRVVNATGIILHTGLGRAFMPEAACEALARVAGYCNLQQDLDTVRGTSARSAWRSWSAT